jgi:molybdopterin-guanine dinucleotide biosynthesis protein A
MNPKKCAGIILSGGLSTRMGGEPKAFMDLAGRQLIQHTIDTLKTVVGEVIIAAKETDDFAQLEGVTLARDVWEVQTPLAGIQAGLEKMSAKYAFCVGCDTPLLRPRVVELLLNAIGPGLDLVVPYSGLHYQPLCAVYSRDCLSLLQRQLTEGDPKVDRLFAGLRMKTVSYAEIEKADPGLESFININTPEDLQSVRALLQQN